LLRHHVLGVPVGPVRVANGSIAAVKVPGTQSLLWFTPGTHAEQWLLRTPAGEAGVEAVVPYCSTDNAC